MTETERERQRETERQRQRQRKRQRKRQRQREIEGRRERNGETPSSLTLRSGTPPTAFHSGCFCGCCCCGPTLSHCLPQSLLSLLLSMRPMLFVSSSSFPPAYPPSTLRPLPLLSLYALLSLQLSARALSIPLKPVPFLCPSVSHLSPSLTEAHQSHAHKAIQQRNGRLGSARLAQHRLRAARRGEARCCAVR